jgi:hypothetical protein
MVNEKSGWDPALAKFSCDRRRLKEMVAHVAIEAAIHYVPLASHSPASIYASDKQIAARGQKNRCAGGYRLMLEHPHNMSVRYFEQVLNAPE